MPDISRPIVERLFDPQWAPRLLREDLDPRRSHTPATLDEAYEAIRAFLAAVAQVLQTGDSPPTEDRHDA
jgi:hypothetical protein